MPGLKRHSIEQDPEDEEDYSSPGPSKRPRTSEPIAPIELSDDQSSDGNDDAESIDEEDLSVALRDRVNRSARTAENGIIESITCTNFMCHAHLHVELGPSINFVIGHNGSGKSAVLTALQICMGGKASNTNRASSLKAFIKEGQDVCTLVVRIKNKDGFQTEVYGDIIQVERTFTKTGTSGFKIKTSAGRTVTTTKGALDEILDYYALSLDNPICVLTQDLAREFLANSTAEQKYKFFIKGVQLEQLNQDYDLLSDSIDHVETVYESRQGDLGTIEKKVKDVERRHKMWKEQSKVHEKCNLLGAQMAWAQVEEEEQKLEEINQGVRDTESRIEALQSDAEQRGLDFDRAVTARDTAKDTEDVEKQKLEPLQIELQAAKAKSDEANKDTTVAHTDQRDCRNKLKSLSASIAKTEEEIREEKQRLSDATGGSASERLDRLTDARKVQTELTREANTHGGDLSGLRDLKSQAEQRVRDHLGPRQAKAAEVSQAEAQLEGLRGNGQRAPNAFNNNLDSLLSAIDTSREFRRKPVGPAGRHVQLLKPEWSSVLEKSLNTQLNSFIVTSREDRERLNSLMRRKNCVMPINIVSSERRFDISANSPPSEFLTIARALNIDDDLVFNHLVINSTFEQIMLIEIENEAHDLMSSQRIQNVKACLTLDQKQPGTGHNLTWNSRGSGISSQYIDRYKGIPRMKSNVEDQIRVQQQVVHRLQGERHEIDNRHRELQRAVETCNRDLAQHKRQQESFKARIAKANELVENIEDEISNSTVEEGRLTVLTERLNDLQKSKQQETESYESIVVQRDELVEKMNDARSALQAVEQRIQAAKEGAEKARNETVKREHEREDALKKKNKAYEAVTATEGERDKRREKRQAQAQKISSYVEQASEVAERVDVPEHETSDSIKKKLDRFLAEVERFEKEAGGTKEQVEAEYNTALEEWSAFKSTMKQEKDFLSIMKQSLANRKTRWRQFRKYISARARYNFMILLSERAFRGKLAIDHDKHLLNLLIQPNETESSSAARQSRTLSGGEKSFSTICLILSLWEAICAPVRCLDEYDVFMDSANRDVSTKLLITAARAAQERQFIFITPQSMTSIPPGTDIKIIKMRDPERGQTTLAFNG